MDKLGAENAVLDLKNAEGHWANPLHIAISIIRRSAIKTLTRDSEVGGIALVEIHLREPYFWVNEIDGIVAADGVGIWFADTDGDIEDASWRQYLLPWASIAGMRMHQVS